MLLINIKMPTILTIMSRINFMLNWVGHKTSFITLRPGLEAIKLEYSLRLKKKGNDWLLADTCPQAANHCALF